jgi:hypothetical protein
VTLTGPERRRLAELADRLIPAEDGMPPGSAGRIDDVLAARPDLAGPLRAILADPCAPDAEQRALVGEVVAGAYFLLEEVKDALGHHGRRAIPIPPTSDHDDLIGPVIRRGPIFRRAPG